MVRWEKICRSSVFFKKHDKQFVLLPFSDEPFNFIPIKNITFFYEYWKGLERKINLKLISKSLKINRYKSTKINSQSNSFETIKLEDSS